VGHTNTISEMTVSKDNPNKGQSQREKIIHQLDWPQFNHNGHWMDFGPDGKLYVSTGDGGYANDWGIGHNVTIGNGQDMKSLHGKMLRSTSTRTTGSRPTIRSSDATTPSR
jgi:glucose/arabinose dehydrogenase